MSDGADSMGVAARVAPEPCVCVRIQCMFEFARKAERKRDRPETEICNFGHLLLVQCEVEKGLRWAVYLGQEGR